MSCIITFLRKHIYWRAFFICKKSISSSRYIVSEAWRKFAEMNKHDFALFLSPRPDASGLVFKDMEIGLLVFEIVLIETWSRYVLSKRT